jgi:selenocysteine lyase/cysteine desulfurase
MQAIREYEAGLSADLIAVLREQGATIYGVSDPGGQRVPTVSFNLRQTPASQVAQQLARSGIGVRDGHMYSPRLMKRLGTTATVRASLVHYNSREEIRRFGEALAAINSAAG